MRSHDTTERLLTLPELAGQTISDIAPAARGLWLRFTSGRRVFVEGALLDAAGAPIAAMNGGQHVAA